MQQTLAIGGLSGRLMVVLIRPVLHAPPVPLFQFANRRSPGEPAQESLAEQVQVVFVIVAVLGKRIGERQRDEQRNAFAFDGTGSTAVRPIFGPG